MVHPRLRYTVLLSLAAVNSLSVFHSCKLGALHTASLTTTGFHLSKLNKSSNVSSRVTHCISLYLILPRSITIHFSSLLHISRHSLYMNCLYIIYIHRMLQWTNFFLGWQGVKNNKFPIIHIQSIKHSSKMYLMPYISSSILQNFLMHSTTDVLKRLF